jgi:hypothetical protein
MSALNWPAKDPDEVLDYRLDWSARLAGDTIFSSSWIVPAGITKNSDTFDNSSTTIWLAAGTTDETYTFVNRVVTAGGRRMDQSVKIKIKVK